jgi:hypothetical protein
MKQYWARHQGKTRWGVRTPLETSDDLYKTAAGLVFIWADRVELRDGSLVFLNDAGVVQGAIAPGRWDAVFEAGPDDGPQAVETKR